MPQHITIRAELVHAKRRETAHRTLDRLIDEAEVAQSYGRVGVEVCLEAGKITVIHRKMEASEK